MSTATERRPATRIAGADFPFWHFPINRPHAGVKLGNNSTGLLVWGEGNELQLSIGVPTLWEHDGGAFWHEGQSFKAIRKVLEAGDEKGLKKIFPPKGKTPQLLPMGRVTITFGGGLRLDKAFLDIRRAILRVDLSGKGGKYASVNVGIDWKSGVVFAELPKLMPEATVRFLTGYEQPRNTETFKNRGMEPPRVEDYGFEQTFPKDDAAGLAVVTDKNVVYAAAARAPKKALEAALKKAEAAAKAGVKALKASTAERWADYWKAVPKVSIPNATLQYLYDYGMYQFGAATDDSPTAVAAPLQGPWYADDCIPPWGGDYHFNINIQEYYWPAYRGNRLEHLMPVFRLIKSWMPRLRENARIFAGIDDGAMLPHAVDDRGVAMTSSFWTGMMDHGSTMWMADMMWRYYEFGGKGGKKFLRDDAMPFMEGAFNVFYKMLDRAKDGTLSLPVGSSPEYRGAEMNAWGRNSSFQLAAAHRLAENLQSAAKELGVKPDPRWAEVSARLPLAAIVDAKAAAEAGRPLPVGAHGAEPAQIGLWDGLVLECSHRHHSHLAGIFPFDTIPVDDPAWHDVLVQSYWHWVESGMVYWSGWCVPWASILHTRVGNADTAEFLLEFWERYFVNEGRGTLHDSHICGLNYMGRPAFAKDAGRGSDIIQFDAAGGATEAILEMLCHERRGVLHLFDGAPKRWLDPSFDGIRTLRGVLVSSSRKNGKVEYVSLAATTAAATVRLANPWPGRAARASDGRKYSGDILEVSLRKGEKIVLR